MPWWLDPVPEPCERSQKLAQQRQQQLTKPAGSLGRLEALAIQFAAWQGRELPVLEQVAIRVFAGDHGVVAEGVSAYPQAVTVEMIRNFARGGAAIALLAREQGADFAVVNLGTVAEVGGYPAVVELRLAPGTANFCREPAMDDATLEAAMAAGAAQVAEGSQLFIGGEMGIGNTTAAAALTSALLDVSPEQSVGRGTGVDDAGLAHKRKVVERALNLQLSHCHSPRETLRRLGGLEIAALTGAYIAAAQRGIPSVVDGYICGAAALLACRLNPAVRDWLLFSHRSAEPGHCHILAALEAEPLLDFGMRLGEGSGAALCLPLLRAACTLHRDMATFAEAGVSGPGQDG